jgi:uncharacterized protein
MAYAKPLPPIDVWSKPFWAACKERRLIAQRCNVSGKTWLPPSPVSPVTRDHNWTWIDLSGLGRIASFVVMHQRYFAGFADELPYPVIQVDLDEGPTLISNIVDLGGRTLEIGMRVKVVFEPVTDDITLPKFAPAGRAEP